jgi:hypothetical protein
MPGEIDPLNAVTSLFPETAKKPVEFFISRDKNPAPLSAGRSGVELA